LPIGIRLKKKEIIDAFEEEHYTILTYNFSKAKDDILVKCIKGHINYRRYDNLKQGKGCPDCKGVKKYTYQYVYNYFKLHDCLLLSKEYKGVKEDLEYLCSCGNPSKISFDNFKNKGERCNKCGSTRKALARKTPYKEVLERIISDGNKLLTTEEDYIDSNSDIVIECNCGNNIFITTFTKYKMRVYQSCLECAHLNMSETKRRSKDDIEIIISSYGLKLIDYNYINNEHVVTFECLCGNPETVNFNVFLMRTHKMCIQCSNEIRFDNSRQYSIEEIRPLFDKRRWQLLSKEFESVDHDLECICDNGHPTKTTLYRFSNGCGCRECFVARNRLENHWHWRGGITDLKLYLREQLKEWKIKSFEKYDYVCVLTNINNKLNIHHLYKSFSEIVYETLEILNLDTRSNIGDYLPEELNNIIVLFQELHDKYGLGVPIESNLHNLFHKLYGTTNNTPEQFEEFTKRYKLGEFEELS